MEEATGGGGNQTTYGKENTPIRGRRVRAQQSLAVNPSSPIRAVQRSYVSQNQGRRLRGSVADRRAPKSRGVRIGERSFRKSAKSVTAPARNRKFAKIYIELYNDSRSYPGKQTDDAPYHIGTETEADPG
jgi:hypothetical protein